MKNIFNTLLMLSALSLAFVSCSDDDGPIDELTAAISGDASVDIEATVQLDGSASIGTILSYEWSVTDPDGSSVSLANAATSTPSFIATKEGTYNVELTINSASASNNVSETVSVVSPTYAIADQMGRPAINTVFNFFGTGEIKNSYNMTLPSNGSANAAAFEGILDALQTYIFLDPAQFENILGIGNGDLAGVLAVDVLQSNKNASSSYGTLNGRALGDDVVDVTLILAFDDQSAAGADNAVKAGVSSDNVDSNDKAFSNTFPYLATPH